LDGAATISQLCKRTAELGATHIAITEHGNLNSAIKLYTESPKFGLKPILGVELYLANPDAEYMRQKYISAWKSKDARFKSRLKDPWAFGNEEKVLAEIERKINDSYFHLTVHFKTYEAYQHFCRLSPKMNDRAIVKYGEVKPIATIEDISPLKGKITIGSSCLVGMIGKTLLGSRDGIIEPNPIKAEEYYLLLRSIVGQDDFFVEIFPHKVTHDWIRPVYNTDGSKKEGTGIFRQNECSPLWLDGDLQKYMNNFILQMAKKYNDKIIVSLDSHYATESQKTTQDIRLGNGDEAWRFDRTYVNSASSYWTI
ncbi:MAG: PHP domain-containing protein, partial [Actinobacteria bacterium]|nr:PHP domain-containing protein [Actinomycetota bacterium]